jgi:hypothetical protein
MRRNRNTISRSETERRITENQEAASEKEEEFEEAVLDSEVVDETCDSLDFGGTDQGADAAEKHLGEAQDAAGEAADQRDVGLERAHEEGEAHEAELDERVESTESDQAKIAQAEHDASTKETLEGIARSLEAIEEDVAYLKESHEKAAESRQESDRRQKELRARIRRKE